LPVRWLVSGLVWAGWCWFVVRGKHCWLAGLGWLKPTSEHGNSFVASGNEIRACLGEEKKRFTSGRQFGILKLNGLLVTEFTSETHMQ